MYACVSDSYFNIKTDGPMVGSVHCLGTPRGMGHARLKCGGAMVGGWVSGWSSAESVCVFAWGGWRCFPKTPAAHHDCRRTVARIDFTVIRLRLRFLPDFIHPPAPDCIFTQGLAVVSVEIIRPFRLPTTATATNARNDYTRARQRPWRWWL